MKRTVLLLLICCLFFSSCDIETDFVISRETVALSESERTEQTKHDNESEILVLINKSSKKYHLDFHCVYASRMSEANRLEMKVKNEEYLLEKGYSPCLKCSSEK
jgi:hypothetical protein